MLLKTVVMCLHPLRCQEKATCFVLGSYESGGLGVCSERILSFL